MFDREDRELLREIKGELEAIDCKLVEILRILKDKDVLRLTGVVSKPITKPLKEH